VLATAVLWHVNHSVCQARYVQTSSVTDVTKHWKSYTQSTNTRLGDRSFSVAGLRLWNSLPASLRQPDIKFGHFKRF